MQRCSFAERITNQLKSKNMSKIICLQSPSALFAMPVFEVTTDSDKLTEIDIYDADDNLLGVKSLVGALNYKVNVATYAKMMVDVSPLPSSVSGFTTPKDRIAVIKAQVDAGSQSMEVVGSREPLYSDRLLSEVPLRRAIAPIECDELSFWVSSGVLKADVVMYDRRGLELHLGQESFRMESQGMASYVVNMSALASKLMGSYNKSIDTFDNFSVRITKDSTLLAEVIYHIEEPSSRRIRLYWWNRYGAIDGYSFNLSGQHNYKVVKSEGQKGGLLQMTPHTISHSYEVVMDVIDGQIQRLVADMVSSPKVWRLDGEYRQIVVQSKEYSLVEGVAEPIRLTITEDEFNGVNMMSDEISY